MGLFLDTAKHKDLIYDIGMHKGEDTEFYLRKGFRVVAFEADPDLVAFCRQRLATFLIQGNLKIIEGAIADLRAVDPGQTKIQFHKNDEVSVWGTIRIDWAERNARLGKSSHIIEVDVVDLAAALAEHGIPYYMKIDIEGCDSTCIHALKGFRERPDYISIESDKTSFADIRREIDLLSDLGYNYFQAVEQSAIHQAQFPPLPAREGAHVAHRFENGSSGLFGSELEDRWKSRKAILRQYRVIRLGYYLLGDDGILKKWKFPGAGPLRSLADRLLQLFTRARVPGWYDTHARHSRAETRKV